MGNSSHLKANQAACQIDQTQLLHNAAVYGEKQTAVGGVGQINPGDFRVESSASPQVTLGDEL